MAITEQKADIEAARRRPRVLPDMMMAAAIDRFGPPDVLAPHSLPVPRVAPSEIAIALHGAGVGIWDAKVRAGALVPKDVHFPYVLGSDGAGLVAARGAHVRRFELGDRVWAYSFNNPKGGFYADYVVLDAHKVGRVPDALDLTYAGMSVVTALTAMQGIEEHLNVRAFDRVLIFGASGAVGTFAVQLAKHRGAYVIATASSREAQELMRQLGADAVIDTRDPRGLARLEQLAPRDLDAVLALAGGDVLERCIDHVRDGGRVAYPYGVEPPPAHRSKLDLIRYDAISETRELDRLAHAFVNAKLKIVIDAEYPLASAADAHRRIEQGRVLGRIGLRIHRTRH